MMTRSYSIKEAKDHLPGLVRQAAKGLRLTITVHGRPLADLVPHDQAAQELNPPLRPIPTRVKLASGVLDALLDDLREDR